MTEKDVQKKSERTKEAIEKAARALFGQNGFERTTVRDIATMAGVDAALVIRYFGGKEQLFARIADFDLKLPDLTLVDRSKLGETLAAHFIRIWEDERANSGMPILLRSAASNEMAAAQVMKVFGAQVMPAIAQIAGREHAPERAALIASQLLGLAFCRYVLKMPPIVALSRERLVEQVGRTLQRYITGE